MTSSARISTTDLHWLALALTVTFFFDNSERTELREHLASGTGLRRLPDPHDRRRCRGPESNRRHHVFRHVKGSGDLLSREC